jgi:hypothetical protein
MGFDDSLVIKTNTVFRALPRDSTFLEYGYFVIRNQRLQLMLDLVMALF